MLIENLELIKDDIMMQIALIHAPPPFCKS
jgi:hypothetical protein